MFYRKNGGFPSPRHVKNQRVIKTWRSNHQQNRKIIKGRWKTMINQTDLIGRSWKIMEYNGWLVGELSFNPSEK
jgi:hypothetical protein